MSNFSKYWVSGRLGQNWLGLCGALLALSCASGSAQRKEGPDSLPVETVAEQPWTAPAMAPAGSPVAQYGALHVTGTQLLNEANQAVQLKGLSTMWLNWETSNRAFSRDKAGLQWFRDKWQLKLFRVAMGVEPSGGYLGSPDSNYKKVQVAVRNAIDLGVYVIIDWHDHHAHLNEAAAIDFFTRMAQEFGKYPNVIYEPFNEPNCREKVDNCKADARVTWSDIKPYHEKIISAIRAVDPDNLIILGTPTWSQDVDKAAADPVVGSNLMYTLHFYSCTHTQWLIDRAEASVQKGLPIFITEWGGTNADGGIDGKVCTPEAQAWFDWMNKRYVSSAAWKLDACADSSCIFSAAGGAKAGGDWPDAAFGGHATLVRDHMKLLAPPLDPAQVGKSAPASTAAVTGTAKPVGSASAMNSAAASSAAASGSAVSTGSAAASGSAEPSASVSADPSSSAAPSSSAPMADAGAE